MKLFKMVLVLICIMFMSSNVFASTAEVVFSFPDTAEDQIDGFRVFEVLGPDSAITIYDETDKTTRVMQFEVGDVTECRTFYMASVSGTVVGPSSNTAALCPDPDVPPEIELPPATTGFGIRLID